MVGAGIMGADHARILHRDVPNADVVMVADVDRDRAEAVVADIPGAVVSGDARALIASPDVDAVLVASSDATHVEYVLACLDLRKPVLCEKPLAPTAAECARIVDAEQAVIAGGLPLVSVGFMRRFDPGYVELRGLVDEGAVGVPLAVHSVGRGVGAPPGSDELTVTGSAIHDFDIVPWLISSPVVEASWLAPRRSPEVTDRQDPQFILLRTADGVLVTVDVFLHARYGYDIRCEVVGSQASASLTEPHRLVRDHGLTRSHGYAADWRPRFAEAYRLQNRAWVESLTAGTPSPLATARDGLQAALVADAVLASMHGGGGFVPVGTTP
ncbi:MAG TPA: inositol 2-dehydrogenase [Actinobacteria bacterium]|nr:inositol 2-dehydrogenase [Actinomycetota bacterium]